MCDTLSVMWLQNLQPKSKWIDSTEPQFGYDHDGKYCAKQSIGRVDCSWIRL